MAAKIISLLVIFVLHLVSMWALRIYAFEVQIKDGLAAALLLTGAGFFMFLSISRNWARLSENHPVLSGFLRAVCLAVSLGCDFASLLNGWQLQPMSLLFATSYAAARWLLIVVRPYCAKVREKTSSHAPLSGNISIWSVVLGAPALYALMHTHGFGLQFQSWWLLCSLLIAQDVTRFLAAGILEEKAG